MKVILAGPVLTSAVADATGIDLRGLPPATAQTPIAPIAAGLLAKGHEVHIVTLDPTLDKVETYTRGKFRITFCPLRAAPRYRARVRSRDMYKVEIRYLADVMRASDADIIHAHWTYEYAEAAIRSRRPMIATMHDLGWDYLFIFKNPYRLIRLLMKYRAMIKIPSLTAVAPFMARKAWQYGYFGRVDIIPNPILIAPFVQKTLERPIIITIGNNGRVKNVGASVTAFGNIQQEYPNAELHLFGPGLDEASQYGNIKGVICHGNVPHRDLMQFIETEARLCIHPSRIECCPVILGEAKMRGVPIIAGAWSGGTGYVCGDFGVLVDINDPTKIAEAALMILNSPESYQTLQFESRRDIEARFSLDSVTSAYVAAYDRVLIGG